MHCFFREAQKEKSPARRTFIFTHLPSSRLSSFRPPGAARLKTVKVRLGFKRRVLYIGRVLVLVLIVETKIVSGADIVSSSCLRRRCIKGLCYSSPPPTSLLIVVSPPFATPMQQSSRAITYNDISNKNKNR